MRPFARELDRAGGPHGLAVWSLRHAVRGWNGDEQSPVADATWALAEITRRHGDVPVVLVGHSMGGRTAVHAAGSPAVVAVCALAPWLPRGEPYEQVAGRAVLVVHGRLDTTTSPRASLAWAREAATVTDRVWRIEVRRERHAMLWRAAFWHRIATEFTRRDPRVRPDAGAAQPSRHPRIASASRCDPLAAAPEPARALPAMAVTAFTPVTLPRLPCVHKRSVHSSVTPRAPPQVPVRAIRGEVP